MTSFTPPLADISFALRAVGGLAAIGRLPGLEAAQPDVVDAVLEEAGKLATGVLAPLNQVGDREGARLENGVVRTAPGFQEAYRQFAAGGWTGLTAPDEMGGQGLPWLVHTAVAELWNAASMTFYLCPLLSQAAAEAVLHYGTEAQKEVYGRKLVSGEWTGAMCLTEPQAGTDVGALKTRALRHGDHYRLKGQKIFITYGEHDLAENIVHMVLARLPDAPEGTRGISLFIVPKFLPDEAGRPGRRNELRCLKLEEKLGVHGSPTCVMSYGDDEGAEAFLLGEENAGMRCMFTMMNNARVAVGHEGLGLAERAYQGALAYAGERIQGRIDGKPAAIVDYPDVRRMLLTMRAQIAAMRALSYWTAGFVDRSMRASEAAERERAADRVALLTPVVKAWCTDTAQEIARAGIQVHGGMGFIEETGAAQHYRDAMVLSIYEGTNGVQAVDLVGRKLGMSGGRLPWELIDELKGWLGPTDQDLHPGLDRGLDALAAATRHLQDVDEARRGAGAAAYLRLMGAVLGGFLLARGAQAGTAESGADWPGLARFYVRHLLPPATALEAVVAADPRDLDPGLLRSIH